MLDGKGGLRADIKGRKSGEGWVVDGGMKVELKDIGFSSPDGTKAGEGIGISLDLDLDFPQEGSDKVSFKMDGSVGGGEYLWGTIYRDLSGRYLACSMEGFFLQTQRPWMPEAPWIFCS